MIITEKESVWERLARSKKPIVLYGMGLGAQKIMRAMEKYQIPIAAVFASDEFVRGQSFCGYPVKTFQQIKELFSDFFIVVSFAFWQQELIDKVTGLSEQYELVAPHVPVAGEDLVTLDWLKQWEVSIREAYELMGDEQSQKVFAATLNYKLSGKISYILSVTTPKSQAYERIIKPTQEDIYLDLGAYDGDTIREVLAYAPLKKIIAVEPDPKNFRKLLAFTQTRQEEILPLNVGIYQEDTQLAFAARAGRHSSLSRDGSGKLTAMRSVDSILEGGPVTLIKMDVEGEEGPALAGAKNTIARYRPRLIVSAYHRSEDTFILPLQIARLCPEYRIDLRQHPYIPAWENNIYALAPAKGF